MNDTASAPNHIVAAGATGFIGRAVTARLLKHGLHVTILTRGTALKPEAAPANLQIVEWKPGDAGDWQHVVREADVVINLAGESVAGRRWTSERKTAIMNSRVDTTKVLVSNMTHGKLVSASAVGYYGNTGDELALEDRSAGNDFLAHVCSAWEKAAQSVSNQSVQTVIFRIGIVLGADGGALPALLQPPFLPFSPWRLGLGGPLGNGRQWMPWIHVDDVANAFVEAVLNPRYQGIYNLTAPNPVVNREFSTVLGEVLKRPAVIPVPAFLLRLLLGEFATTLLGGQRAVPANLTKSGFLFEYPHLREALNAILHND